MDNPTTTLAEEARNLVFNFPEDPGDDPLTFRKKNPDDPSSPWLIRVCMKQTAPIAKWKDYAKDFKPPTEDMLLHINRTLEKIKNHPRLKGHIEIEFVEEPRLADINYMQAKSGHSGDSEKGFAGIQSGWLDEIGQVHKEVLLNPNSQSWIHTEDYNKPNHENNPKNPYGNGAREVEHETAHAFGLRHWGETDPLKSLEAGYNAKVNTDKTVMAYYFDGKNPQYDYRPADWQALASHYVMLNRDIRSAKIDQPGVVSFNEAENVAVFASDAANLSVSNHGTGGIIIKMTEDQYDKSEIAQRTAANGSTYYTLFFDKDKTINLQSDAKIAMMLGGEGGLTETMYIKDVLLNAALKNATAQKKPEAEANHNNITAPADIPLNPFAGKNVGKAP